MRSLKWISALFLAALAPPLYRDLTGPAARWPLELLAAHALGGAVLLLGASAVVPVLVYDIDRLRGRAPAFPFCMWALLLAGLVALAFYGG